MLFSADEHQNLVEVSEGMPTHPFDLKLDPQPTLSVELEVCCISVRKTPAVESSFGTSCLFSVMSFPLVPLEELTKIYVKSYIGIIYIYVSLDVCMYVLACHYSSKNLSSVQ